MREAEAWVALQAEQVLMQTVLSPAVSSAVSPLGSCRESPRDRVVDEELLAGCSSWCCAGLMQASAGILR